jgi:hypothetical protein
VALVPYTKGSRRAKNAWEPIDPSLNHTHIKILNLVGKRKRGMTCDQVEVTGEIIHQTASARITELVQKGYLIDTGNTRLTRSGHPARVLRSEWPKKKTPKQMLLLKEDDGEEKK